ncbi:unnamed protein product [Adineta steineri]|uniref:Putative auto-transporter adhesin head GIN domain-containing protein n=1 Tax=Adineta steineri TaxID=433720 RepID=A0A814RTP1_9BILA|nr:unnamed protein product [Adineta steineri]
MHMRLYIIKISSKIIFLIFYASFVFQLTKGQQKNIHFLLPNVSSSIHSLLNPTIHKVYSFTLNSFTKINLVGGPFNIKLNQISYLNNNHTSVDINAEESIHNSILIDIVQNDILFIRMIENINLINKTKIIITINYFNLTELHVSGMINIQCLNQIQTDKFYLYNRATGCLKLKLNVNTLDAYFHSNGRVKLCGQVNEEATLQSLGVGDIQCRNLFTKKINVISSGIGNIYVTATDEINIILSGIGTIYYTGPLKQQIKTGLGNIIEAVD